MSWFSALFGPNGWDTGEVAVPWAKDRPSIYQFILGHLNPGGSGLAEGGETLPDEEVFSHGQELHFAPGALDGILGHHMGGGSDARRTAAVLSAMRKALDRPDWHRMKVFYDRTVEDSMSGIADALMERIVASGRSIHVERMAKLGRLFAAEAPDREAVKLGILLCGMVAGSDRDLFLTLARHEEFTLFALAALIGQAQARGEAFPEADVWQLARNVHGWGRIHAVERLAGTQDSEIKAWLLREGYSNAIMDGYLAYTAATTGGLLDALRGAEPDNALLDGAGGIIEALIEGGPAEDIDDYEDGLEVLTLYLGHMRSRARTLKQLVSTVEIREFLSSADGPLGDAPDPMIAFQLGPEKAAEVLEQAKAEQEAAWEARRKRGWTDERLQALVAVAGEILAQQHWHDLGVEGLSAADHFAFWTARRAALALGIDPWEYSFERQRADRGDEWFNLMRTDDPERVDRVIALAEEMIPLERVATGPGDEMGLGPQFAHHHSLDFILQDLGRFPGKGWPLIRAGLLSPVVRNHHMAIRAFSAWEREAWPADAEETLRRAGVPEKQIEMARAGITITGRPMPDP